MVSRGSDSKDSDSERALDASSQGSTDVASEAPRRTVRTERRPDPQDDESEDDEGEQDEENEDDEDEDEDEDDEDGARRQAAVPLGTRIVEFVKERYFGADPRWLGVHRICLGILLMVEVIRRMVHARAFYSNDGLLPNHFSLFRPMGRNLFSIYHAFSTYGEVQVAFTLTLLVFFLFTIGYKTKLFHALSAVCIVSLNNRNIFVENGGTVVVNIMTVYTLFLPMGKRFSVDAVLRSLKLKQDQSQHDLNLKPDPFRTSARVYSLMMLLFLVQWSAIYFFNAAHKDGIGWRNGTALHWFFWQDRIVTDLGIWARENLSLPTMKFMTYSTLLMEGALAGLILFPFWQTWTRRLIFVLVLMLHGGIAATSRIGPFSYVMSLFPILLLGARDFELVSRWFAKPRRARTVVFRGDTGLCFQVCRVLDRLDPFERLTFVDHRQTDQLPKGYDAKAGLSVFDPASRRWFVKERALSQALFVLPFGWLYCFWPRLPIASHFVGRALGSRKARTSVSEWWGARTGALAPESAPRDVERFREHKGTLRVELERFGFGLKELLVAFLFTACVMAIIHDNRFVAKHFKIKRPDWTLKVMEYPRLLQGWGMFAPEPPFEDGRVVVDGRTKDGRKLDPLTGEEPEFDPHSLEGWGHNQFWCDYHNRIRYSGHAPNRQHLRDYLLNHHKFTGKPEDQLVSFDVWWVQDQSPMPGESRGKPLRPLKLTSHGKVTDSGARDWLKYPTRHSIDWSKIN